MIPAMGLSVLARFQWPDPETYSFILRVPLSASEKKAGFVRLSENHSNVMPPVRFAPSSLQGGQVALKNTKPIWFMVIVLLSDVAHQQPVQFFPTGANRETHFPSIVKQNR